MRINLEQGTPEWKEMRRRHVTGTDISIILGVNPYGKSTEKLLLQKLELEPDDEVNEAMKIGSALEPEARKIFNNRTFSLMMPSVHVHDEEEWAMCSTDGIDFDGKEILEVKCSQKSYESLLASGVPPIFHEYQMQYNMWVSGTQICHYVCYWGGTYVAVRVLRSEEIISQLIDAGREFYDKMLNADIEALGIEDRDDEAFEEASFKWKEAKGLLIRAEALEKEAKADLASLVVSRGARGFGVQIKRASKKGAVDYERIPELNGVNLDAYRKSPSFWWDVKNLKEKQ